jgi:O-antigen/teichoic acid export membrane protein
MSKNKQLFINITASFVAFFISAGINFFLSKYIVQSVGAEAYGFIQVSNTFLSYFSVITVAINCMSSRFISISYFRGEANEASGYFSSTFFANLILSAFFTPIFLIVTLNIARLVNISPNLVLDVQFLLGFTCINFIVGILTTNLTVSYYIKNKLYISSLISIAGYILRALLLLLLFSNFKPYVAYTSVVMLIVTLFTQLCNIYFKNKLIPDLKIRLSSFSRTKVKTLITSGIWTSVTRMGTILSEGLDLLMSNLLLSAADMGVLAIAKTIPNMINNILNTMIGTFLPNLTELYAQNKIQEMVKEIKYSMSIIGLIINIPIGILIGFGSYIFYLWVPSQNALYLQILSVMTIAPWAIMGQVTIIHNVFTIINKIKVNSILICFTGLFNVAIVYILLKTTNLGLFAVASVSSIISILRDLCYTVPYGAIYLGCNRFTFFPDVLKSIISVIAISVISLIVKHFMPWVSWKYLILCVGITAILGLIFNIIFVLSPDTRKQLFSSLKEKFAQKKC